MRFELSFLYVCGAVKRTIINVSRATTTTTISLSAQTDLWYFERARIRKKKQAAAHTQRNQVK